MRNTFLHVAVPEMVAAEAQVEQPDLRRVSTVPVTMPREESSDDNEEGQDWEERTRASEGSHDDESSNCSPQPCLLRVKTHDPFEVGCVRKQPSISRIETHDPCKSPTAWEQLDPHRADMRNPFGLGIENMQPSSWQPHAHDLGGMRAWMDTAAAHFLLSAAGAQACNVAMQSGTPPNTLESSSSVQPWEVGVARGKTIPHRALPSRTTVMLRNLPNNYTRTMLLDLIDCAGFAGRFDFLYLPMDFRKDAALGYAFVNLVSTQDAERLLEFFDGFSHWALPSSKVCRSGWSHPHQGLEIHIARYRNSPLMHKAVPDEFRPVMFAYGLRIPFPPPTKKIKPPRQGAERVLV